MRQDEPRAFDVVLFTDPQPETDAEVDFIREDVIQALAGVDAKFGLTAGDIMFDDLSLYPRYNAIIGTIGLTWWNIGGNHDLNFEAPDRRYSRETYKRVFGPNYYAFFYAETLFLMLDDVDYLGADPAQAARRGQVRGPARRGGNSSSCATCSRTRRTTRSSSSSCTSRSAPTLGPEAWQNLVNKEALFELFEGRRYTVSFSGHTHTTEHHYFDAADGWKGRDAAPPSRADGAVRLVVERTLRSSRRGRSRQPRRHAQRLPHPLGRRRSYTTRFVPAKEPNGRQMRLSIDSRFHGISKDADRDFRQARLLGSPVPRDALSASTLIANVFDGGDKTKVTMTIGDRGPVPMTRRARPDPFVEEVFARNEATKKSWVKAEVSSHIWTARLPGDLEPGAYRVIVEAINEYGRPVTGRLALEVTG